MWPYYDDYDNKRMIFYSGDYTFTPITQKQSVIVKYSIQASVVDRKLFRDKKMLDEKNQRINLYSLIGDKIRLCLLPYQPVYKSEYNVCDFHKIIDITKGKILIEEELEIISNIIEKIEEEVKGLTTCGVEIDYINFLGVRRMLEPEEFMEEAEKMKGTFIPLDEIQRAGIKIYNNYCISVVPLIFDDYIQIQWKHIEKRPFGSIKIFRCTGGFSRDRWSETDNGIMVVDSFETNGVFLDNEGCDIQRNITYYYTVIYALKNHQGLFKTIFAQGKPPIYHIARFAVAVTTKKPVKQPEKSETERLIEKQTKERVEQVITQDHKREQMFNDLKASIKNKETADAFIIAYKEKRLNEIKTSKGHINKEDMEYVEQIVEDLEDRANTILSEIDEK